MTGWRRQHVDIARSRVHGAADGRRARQNGGMSCPVWMLRRADDAVRSDDPAGRDSAPAGGDSGLTGGDSDFAGGDSVAGVNATSGRGASSR